jgi:hypothetical protein
VETQPLFDGEATAAGIRERRRSERVAQDPRPAASLRGAVRGVEPPDDQLEASAST